VEAGETSQAVEPSIAKPTRETNAKQETQASAKEKEEAWRRKDVVETLRTKRKRQRGVHGPPTHVRKFRKKRNER